MMNSLAITDALLSAVTVWLASRSFFPIGYRIAFLLLAISALLGFLRFSGLYPLETWHPLFALFGASAALPLLAICVLRPKSLVTTRKQFALIFLCIAMLLGLIIAGLGKIRLYDQLLGLMSMLIMLGVLIKQGEFRRSVGPALMLLGSLLFVLKVDTSPWLLPGDWLHLGMAFGLLLFVPKTQFRTSLLSN